MFDPAADQPYANYTPAEHVATAAHSQLALEGAQQSVVLLKNAAGALPFGPGVRTVAVIGPNGDATTTMQVRRRRSSRRMGRGNGKLRMRMMMMDDDG